MSDLAAEQRHDVPPDELWNESWYFDFANQDLNGGYIRLGLYPNLGVLWWWAYLVVEGRLIVVRDHAAKLPAGSGLDTKNDSLSAEIVCEKPMERWSIGMEAAGVELAKAADAYTGEKGVKLPVGLELTWEAMTPPFWYPERVTHHYQHAGRVAGRITIGDKTLEYNGMGERDHSWGVRDWWRVPWHWSAFQIGEKLAGHILQVRVDEGAFAFGYLARGGGEPVMITKVEAHTELGEENIPTKASYLLDEKLPFEVVVERPAPVPLESLDGRYARFPRALCRFESPEGSGMGWGEWLQL